MTGSLSGSSYKRVRQVTNVLTDRLVALSQLPIGRFLSSAELMVGQSVSWALPQKKEPHTGPKRGCMIRQVAEVCILSCRGKVSLPGDPLPQQRSGEVVPALHAEGQPGGGVLPPGDPAEHRQAVRVAQAAPRQ